jgi:hypothetical protein
MGTKKKIAERRSIPTGWRHASPAQEACNSVVCRGTNRTRSASTITKMDSNSLWYDTMATHRIAFNAVLLINRRPSTIRAAIFGGNEKHAVSCEGDLLVTDGPNGPVVFTGTL